MNENKKVVVRWRQVAGQTRFTVDGAAVPAEAIESLNTAQKIEHVLSQTVAQEWRRALWERLRVKLGEEVATAMVGRDGALSSSTTVKFARQNAPTLPEVILSGMLPPGGELPLTVTSDEYDRLMAATVGPESVRAVEGRGEAGAAANEDNRAVGGRSGEDLFRDHLERFVAAFENDTNLFRLAERAYDDDHPGERGSGYLIESQHPWYGLPESQLADRVGNVCDPDHILHYHAAKRDLERLRRR